MTTATTAYQQKRKEIDKQLKQLNKVIKQMDKFQKKSPENWGFTGSAGHICMDLHELLIFINA
jgi:uncharacterized protein YacL (UPF0231 family)